MQGNRTDILSTAPLPQALLDKAMSAGLRIDVIPFINTEYVKDDMITSRITELAEQNIHVVFTSTNAVEVVAALLNNARPHWNIHCMQGNTSAQVEKYFGADKIKSTAANASALAEMLISDGVETAVFFCGDIRRDELPTALAQHNIALEELVVYKTIQIPQHVAKDYDAVLFYSPSAAEAFFLQNEIYADTLLFAIGNTTATALKNLSTNEIVISPAATKEALVNELINYYATKKISAS